MHICECWAIAELKNKIFDSNWCALACHCISFASLIWFFMFEFFFLFQYNEPRLSVWQQQQKNRTTCASDAFFSLHCAIFMIYTVFFSGDFWFVLFCFCSCVLVAFYIIVYVKLIDDFFKPYITNKRIGRKKNRFIFKFLKCVDRHLISCCSSFHNFFLFRLSQSIILHLS